jgi:hypothetical protein
LRLLRWFAKHVREPLVKRAPIRGAGSQPPLHLPNVHELNA